MSSTAKKDPLAAADRLTLDETAEVLNEIQDCFVTRASNVIDDETDRLRISELCRGPSDTVVRVSDDDPLIKSFREAVALADRQYAGDLQNAQMNSSGEAMYRVPRLPACERAGVIQENLRRWREYSMEAIRLWAPKFFTIACSFPHQINLAPSVWTKTKLLAGVTRRLRPAQLGAVTFWLRAACGERYKKDLDPSEPQTPWRVPTWFVALQTAPASTPDLGISSLAGSNHHTQARLKMNDPDRNPTMTPREVMAALQLSKSTVYEHPGLDRDSNGTRAVRFTTKSVLAIKNSAPE